MNEKKHWNKIGKNYEGEIFNVFESDLKKIIRKRVRQYANKTKTSLDFGCGTGRAFSLLAPAFKNVFGFDISKELLAQAQNTGYNNVILQQADLTRPDIKLPAVDFVFSCNVIMLPLAQQNAAMLHNVHRALKRGGSAVLVMPSLESVLFSSAQLIRWYEREGVPSEKISDDEFAYYKTQRNILEGIIHIDGVPTKHYSEPELRIIFRDAKLAVVSIDKVEYAWDTEFESPPKWMRDPYPWDWLVECRKM